MTRVRFLKIIFVLAAVVIVGRTLQLQMSADPRLERLAHRQFNAKATALPRRGFIFDRNGEGLAISLKANSLFFRPEQVKKEVRTADRGRIASMLSRILSVPAGQIRSKLESHKGFVWMKRHLSPAEEKAIRERGILDYTDGIGLVEEAQRFYPSKDLASHVLGSVGVDGQGLEGLELFYEGLLAGEKTRVSSLKDAMGRRIFRDEAGLLAFKDGQSLVLTLDKAIQYEAEKALRQGIEEHQAKAGTVIVAEIPTGEILAMANFPTFNPNNSRSAAPDTRRNRAITDTFEPGSTFKPLLVGMALEKGRSPKAQFYCERGTFKIEDRRISEAEAHEKWEWLTMGEIVKYSSNIGAAKLALDLGPNVVSQLAERLGIGSRTGIDLPGEVPGRFNRAELRSRVRLANVGFGHGFTVTPLQMLTYYLAVANGGDWIQPKLVKAILAEDPESLERGSIRWKLGRRFDSPGTRKVFSRNVAHQLTAMLEDVVREGGTATGAQLPEWPVAGKTGTAQKVDPETRRYSRTRYISSFVGFAPAQSPRLVTLVVLDEPMKKYYGAQTAAPVFREVMRSGLLRERVPALDARARILEVANRSVIQSVETALRASAVSKTAPTEAGTTEAQADDGGPRMPDLRGKTVREALHVLGSRPMDLEISGSGVLREQSPPAGHPIAEGARVHLVFE